MFLLGLLLIDDDPMVRNAFAAQLEQHGVDVVTASDGKQAIGIYNKQQFDLVISDFGMTGMTGADVVRAVREIDKSQKIAVVSGWPQQDIQIYFDNDAAPDLIVQKPITNEDVQGLLKLAAPRLADTECK